MTLDGRSSFTLVIILRNTNAFLPNANIFYNGWLKSDKIEYDLDRDIEMAQCRRKNSKNV
jgi:hypothetical protein